MKRENETSAKRFLMRYIHLSGQIESLAWTIKREIERAQNTSFSLKPDKVSSSPVYDSMAVDVCNAADACEILRKRKEQVANALQEIFDAIDSLSDERYKDLLTRRYIKGDSMERISYQMHYKKTQLYVIHEKALEEIEAWLDAHADKPLYFAG